jgi:guanylate kinase
VAELERRLRGRKTDSEDVVRRRLRDAVSDMAHWAEFEHLLINDDFDATLERLAAIVTGREQGCRTILPAVRAMAESALLA